MRALIAGIFLLGASLCAAAAGGTACAQQPHFEGSQTITSFKPGNYVSFVPGDPVKVVAGKAAVIPLHFRIAEGMHINSHLPRTKELIPTQLAVPEISGINVVTVDFPAGSDYSFTFMPKEKLSVYAGEFVLRAHVVAQAGDHPVQALLRYQACDATTCYPPRTIPASFEVVAK